MAPLGDLDLDVSERTGDGVGTMSEFVQQHMTNILQPFADHLDELHRSVEILTTDLGQVTEQAFGNSDQLATHSALCAGLRSGLDAAAELAERNRVGLERVEAVLAAQESEARHTQLRLAAVEGSLGSDANNPGSGRGIITAVSEIRRELVLTNTSVGLLQHGLHGTTAVTRQATAALARLEEDVRSLETTHRDTHQLLVDTVGSGEKTQQEQSLASKLSEKNKREAEDVIAHLTQKMAELAGELKETARRQETHADHLKVTNASARSLKVRCDQLESSNKGLVAQQGTVCLDMGKFAGAHAGLRSEFDKLNSSFGADADASKKKNIFETVEKLTSRVTKNSSDVDKLERRVQDSEGRLGKESSRITDVDRQQDVHSERIRKVEEMVGINDEATPMAQRSMSKSMTRTSFGMDAPATPLSSQKAQKDWSLNKGQNQGLKRIDALVGEAQKNRMGISKNEQGLVTLDSRMLSLETQIERQNELMAKMNAGLDQGKENWAGLSKGFRDVHRTVEQGDMLPVRGSHAATLPARPVTRDITDEAMSGRLAATLPPLGRGRGPSPTTGTSGSMTAR